MYFLRIRLRPDIYRSTQLAKVITKNSYSMHRLFWDLFTEDRKRNFLFREEIAREQLGMRSNARGEPVYYVVSATRPKTDNPLFQVDEKAYQPQLHKGDRLRFELRANPTISKKGKKHDVAMDVQIGFLTALCEGFKLQSHLPSTPKKQAFKKVLLAHGDKALDDKLTSLLKGDARYADRLQQSLQLGDKLEWVIKTMVDGALENWMNKKGRRNGFVICKDEYGQYKLQSSGYRWHSIKANKGIKSGFSSVDFTGELEVVDVGKFSKALFEGVGRSKAFGCGLMLIKRI